MFLKQCAYSNVAPIYIKQKSTRKGEINPNHSERLENTFQCQRTGRQNQ